MFSRRAKVIEFRVLERQAGYWFLTTIIKQRERGDFFKIHLVFYFTI